MLAVLWLSAALSAIAFSLATTVRGETERTSASLDALRTYYLAAGAIERAMLYMLWGPQSTGPDGVSLLFNQGQSVIRLVFPTGEALVEVIPESAKLNINSARPEELAALMINLGETPDRAAAVASAIVDWRTPLPAAPSPAHSSPGPSFQPRHASMEEIEELLTVTGMTTDLFYGTWQRGPQGRLAPRGGLNECVSVYGGSGAIDVNTAHPAVLAAAGLAPEAVAVIVQRRRAEPFRRAEDLRLFAQGLGPAGQRLRVGGGPVFTLRATARLRSADGTLSVSRRGVAAMVRIFTPKEDGAPYRILRWHDHVVSNLEWSN